MCNILPSQMARFWMPTAPKLPQPAIKGSTRPRATPQSWATIRSDLKVTAIGAWKSSGMPYGGRYPCANLVHNGVWYYGTYACDINLRKADGVVYNWAWLGPFMGCRYSLDLGKTWVESPCKAWAPLFKEDIHNQGAKLQALEHHKKDMRGDAPGSDVGSLIPGVSLPKLGVMHFVDFGKNMEHSPDGKAYMVGHGAAPNERMFVSAPSAGSQEMQFI